MPDRGEAESGFEEEILKPSVTAFIFGSGQIFGGENDEVDGAVT